MDDLAEFIGSETVETFAPFRRALHIASVDRPHHRRLLLPRSDGLYDAKVPDGMRFHGRDFDWREVQEVRMHVVVVRHQIIRYDRMQR